MRCRWHIRVRCQDLRAWQPVPVSNLRSPLRGTGGNAAPVARSAHAREPDHEAPVDVLPALAAVSAGAVRVRAGRSVAETAVQAGAASLPVLAPVPTFTPVPILGSRVRAGGPPLAYATPAPSTAEAAPCPANRAVPQPALRQGSATGRAEPAAERTSGPAPNLATGHGDWALCRRPPGR